MWNFYVCISLHSIINRQKMWKWDFLAYFTQLKTKYRPSKVHPHWHWKPGIRPERKPNKLCLAEIAVPTFCWCQYLDSFEFCLPTTQGSESTKEMLAWGLALPQIDWYLRSSTLNKHVSIYGFLEHPILIGPDVGLLGHTCRGVFSWD